MCLIRGRGFAGGEFVLNRAGVVCGDAWPRHVIYHFSLSVKDKLRVCVIEWAVLQWVPH